MNDATPYQKFIAERMAAGDDPNEIMGQIEDAIVEPAIAAGWALFGDGNWRLDTCCSICGAWCAGICGHENDPKQKVIPMREFIAARG